MRDRQAMPSKNRALRLGGPHSWQPVPEAGDDDATITRCKRCYMRRTKRPGVGPIYTDDSGVVRMLSPQSTPPCYPREDA